MTDLDELSQKLRAAEKEIRHEEAAQHGQVSSGATGDAMRLAVDLVVAVVVGAGIGWLLDGWLGTKPWFIIIFSILGVAAGFRNFYLFAGKLLRPD